MTSRMANEANWLEGEVSPVVRGYRYVSDANSEMHQAQQSGWTVDEVKVNGLTVTPISQSSWWVEAMGPQLFLNPDNSVHLKVWPRFRGSRWNWLGLASSVASMPYGAPPTAPFTAVEVTYIRHGRTNGR